jgi:predicted DNA-binding transcriptional regulator YafY
MRSSRLLSILILLQLRRQLTAEYLAAELEVSVRTIYRDIDALSAAGVPVFGNAGPGGGFQLIEGYRTHLTGLDSDEAEALFLIGMPNVAAALGMGNSATRARNKLLASLPSAGTQKASGIAGRFYLDSMEWYRTARPTPFLSLIARALLDQQSVQMRYTSWTATREWRIEPLGLVLKAGNWYLVARSDDKFVRFNVADIHSLEVIDASFERPEHFHLETWWNDANDGFEKRLRPIAARLRASPLGLERLVKLGSWAEKAAGQAENPDSEGWKLVTLPIENIDDGAPLLLGIGPEIEVIAPAELRVKVLNLAEEIVARMKEMDVDRP